MPHKISDFQQNISQMTQAQRASGQERENRKNKGKQS